MVEAAQSIIGSGEAPVQAQETMGFAKGHSIESRMMTQF